MTKKRSVADTSPRMLEGGEMENHFSVGILKEKRYQSPFPLPKGDPRKVMILEPFFERTEDKRKIPKLTESVIEVIILL